MSEDVAAAAASDVHSAVAYCLVVTPVAVTIASAFADAVSSSALAAAASITGADTFTRSWCMLTG